MVAILFLIWYNDENRMGGIDLSDYTNATDDEINAFLEAFRNAEKIIFLSRPKNDELLEKLELDEDSAIECAKELSAKNYFKGPKADFHVARKERGETVWEFKTKIDEIVIYMKLQVRIVPLGQAIVISFHEDEF